MVLIRGIYGERYARKIEKGIVSFHDLLSTLAERNESMYEYSDYDETIIKYIVRDSMHPALNESEFPPEISNKLYLILNPIIPHMYATYFHIVNQNSISWIDNFNDNDVHFIYIEPKIDKVSGNMIGKNLLGRDMKYVQHAREHEVSDFLLNTTGMVCIFDNDLKRKPTLEQVESHLGAFVRILHGFYTRMIMSKFTDSENEFRILFKTPTYISRKTGLYNSRNPRLLTLKIDSIEYRGYIEFDLFSLGCISTIDVYLHSKTPEFGKINTTLSTEIKKGAQFSLVPDFLDVDIRKDTNRYGYIGNKEDCKAFVMKALDQQKL